MFAKTKIQFQIFAITLFIIGGSFVFFTSNAEAAAGIFKQINFQGKVVNKTAGTNVADGNYDFTFVLYDAASAGTTLWTEARTGGNQVAVADGIFQVNLGSVTALPSTAILNVDNLYLGINFAGDGEMTTRVRFTAAPYAFNADNANSLAGGTWETPGTIGSTTQNTGDFTTLNANSISTDTGGISIAAGQAYTGAGAVTLSSGGAAGLTLDSASDTLTIAASDTSLTASGVTTFTLGANTTITNASGNISLQAAGTGTANIQIGDGGAASGTPDLFILDIGSAEPTGSIGAMYYSTALNKFRCYQVSAWADCIGVGGSGYATIQDEAGALTQRSIINFTGAGVTCVDNAGNTRTDCTIAGGGSGTLQGSYDQASGNSITTATAKNIVFTLGEVATPTSLTLENQDTAGVSAQRIFNSISSGTLTNGLLVENTGAGTMTNGISIAETAGAIATGINIGNNVATGISIGTGTTTGISVGSGGISISAGALAVNSDSITADGAILTINAAGTVDVTDILNADSITSDAGVSIAAAGSYTGAGAVTLSSGAGGALTINSNAGGAINIGDDASAETISIGTGAAVKTLVIGSLNTTSGVTIQSGATSAGIGLQANGTNVTGTVQIGDGGAGSNNPDVLALSVKNNAGLPTAVKGGMYFDGINSKFKCSTDGAAWVDCDTTGGGGGPIGSDTQVAFNNAGTESGDAGFTFNSSTQTLGLTGADPELVLGAITNEPTAPVGNDLNIYAKSIAGRMLPKWQGPSGFDTPFQSALFGNNISMWMPSTGTTVAINWGTNWTARNSGTGAAQSTPAKTSTNLYSSMSRGCFGTGTTAAGTSGIQSGQLLSWRGNAAGLGGLFYSARVGVDTTYRNNVRMMTGLSALNAAMSAEPSTVNNSIMLGKDTTDTTWQVFIKGTGTVTKVNTGVTIASGDIMDFYIFAKPNDNKITIRLVKQAASGQTVILDNVEYNDTTYNLPATNVFLYAWHGISSASASTTSLYCLNRMYVESDI